MPGGGRPLHSFWGSAHYEAVRVQGKIHALCLLCNKQLTNTAKVRLQMHRNICPARAVPPEIKKVDPLEIKRIKLDVEEYEDTKVKEELRCEQENSNSTLEREATVEDDETIEIFQEMINDEGEDTAEEEISQEPIIQNDECISKLLITKLEPSTSQIMSYSIQRSIPTISGIKRDEDDEIDERLTEFFLGCNIPFTVVESPYFRNFINSLNNSYAVPRVNRLHSSLLDRINEKHQPKGVPCKEGNAVLLLSGLESSKGIVACIQTEDEIRYFLNFWDFDGDVRQGSEELCNRRLEQIANIFDECKSIAKEMYNADLYAAVLDGLEMNLLMGTMWFSTCNGYAANQLAQDVIDFHLMDKIVQILKDFEKQGIAEELIRRGGCKIVLPWKGKWCTYRESLHGFLKNYDAMHAIILERKHLFDKTLIEFIFSQDTLLAAQTMFEALNTVCKLIYIFQKKKTTLAEAVEEWLNLKLHNKFDHILEQRRKSTLSPAAMAANFVDPRFRGSRLSEDQLDSVEDFFLEQLAADGLDDLFVFKANNGIFKTLAEKAIIKPATFWGLAERKHPEFSKLAKKLLKVPASSSQLEKLYSSFAQVHMSAVRNMLGLEKLRKLIKTYFNLRLKGVRTE